MSTEDQQDPTSSRNWQLARSRQVIETAPGEIVAEFFDIGQSRAQPWKRRPEAARLLETFKNPNRGFDAVVTGKPQRAFCGNRFGLTFPVFTHYGVGMWVPEVGGAVDPGSEAHDLVMSLYGGMSKGERTRIKARVRTAMAAQAVVEGRFLGGRPPYGYLLVDAGPHPNPSKAADGKRLHRLAAQGRCGCQAPGRCGLRWPLVSKSLANGTFPGLVTPSDQHLYQCRRGDFDHQPPGPARWLASGGLKVEGQHRSGAPPTPVSTSRSALPT